MFGFGYKTLLTVGGPGYFSLLYQLHLQFVHYHFQIKSLQIHFTFLSIRFLHVYNTAEINFNCS